MFGVPVASLSSVPAAHCPFWLLNNLLVGSYQIKKDITDVLCCLLESYFSQYEILWHLLLLKKFSS